MQNPERKVPVMRTLAVLSLVPITVMLLVFFGEEIRAFLQTELTTIGTVLAYFICVSFGFILVLFRIIKNS